MPQAEKLGKGCPQGEKRQVRYNEPGSKSEESMQNMIAPELVVITGPMCSGKSEELLREMRRAQIAEIPFVLFKPSIDTRTEQLVKSRNGLELSATEVETAEDMLQYVSPDHKWIGIDEGHFFKMDLFRMVRLFVEQRKRVVVAGLDLDYQANPFEVMAPLLSYATEVRKLTAVCSKCHVRHATRTYRRSGHDQRIVVGDKEYEPRCLECFLST